MEEMKIELISRIIEYGNICAVEALSMQNFDEMILYQSIQKKGHIIMSIHEVLKYLGT